MVFESIFRCCFGKLSCEVCIVICCNDFLFVMYNVGICLESKYMVCSSKVDLFVFGLLLIKIVVFGIILLLSMWFSFLKLLVNWGIFCKLILVKVCIFVLRVFV